MSKQSRRVGTFLFVMVMLSQACLKQQKDTIAYSKAVQQKKVVLDKALMGTWDNESYFDLVKAEKDYIEPDAEVSPFGIFTFDDDFLSADTPTILSSSYEAGSCLFYGKYDSVKNTYSFVCDFDAKIGFTINALNGNTFVCVTTTGKKYRYEKLKKGDVWEQRFAKYNKALIAGKYYNKNNPDEIIEFGLPDKIISGFYGFKQYKLNVWSADYDGVLTLFNDEGSPKKYFKYKLTQSTVSFTPLNENLEKTEETIVYYSFK